MNPLNHPLIAGTVAFGISAGRWLNRNEPGPRKCPAAGTKEQAKRRAKIAAQSRLRNRC